MEALIGLLMFGIIVGLAVTVFLRAIRTPPVSPPEPHPSIERADQSEPAASASTPLTTAVPPPSTRSIPKQSPSRSAPQHAPFSAATSTPAAQPTFLKGRAYVVDGDTLKIQKTQIRLFGIDAPEMNHPFGKRSKWAMFEMCKNQIVTAEITDTDVHGRTVAKCTLSDGRDLSAELVKQGLALDWPKYSGGLYRALETPDARRKLWLADARQKGRMHVWDKFDAQQKAKASKKHRTEISPCKPP